MLKEQMQFCQLQKFNQNHDKKNKVKTEQQ